MDKEDDRRSVESVVLHVMVHVFIRDKNREKFNFHLCTCILLENVLGLGLPILNKNAALSCVYTYFALIHGSKRVEDYEDFARPGPTISVRNILF
jgi:hypothetical protein